MSKQNITVAEYITQQIALCGKTQIDICREIGYDNPNIVTMFKQGKTKVPINKVKSFAAALEVDPVFFLRLVMREYMPDTWEVVESILGTTVVMEHEKSILNVIRQADSGLPVEPTNDGEKDELRAIVKSWVNKHENAYRSRLRTKEIN